MERKLIDYLPTFLREYAELRGVMDGEQPEFERAWNAADAVLDNQFIYTADSDGLSRWESLLGITPKGTYTLDERRFNILTRINQELPYTLPQLRVMLEALCGTGNYTARVTDYVLLVKIALVAKNSFDDVADLLDRITPVNMVIDLQQIYNTHAEVGRYTHAALAAWTHSQIRSEVFTDGN